MIFRDRPLNLSASDDITPTVSRGIVADPGTQYNQRHLGDEYGDYDKLIPGS